MDRLYEIKIGDKFAIKRKFISNEVSSKKIKLRRGLYLGYYPYNDTFQPYNPSSLISKGKFVITKVNSKWWQFWTKNKIIDIQLECIEL